MHGSSAGRSGPHRRPSRHPSKGTAKAKLALARGKRAHDKCQVMARHNAQREMVRELPRCRKGMT